MKKLVLLLFGSLLVSNLAFSNNLDSIESKSKSEKIEKIKEAVDSLIRCELGDLRIDYKFDEKSHNYAKMSIEGKDISSYDGIHFNVIKKTKIENDSIKIYDFPVDHFTETIKKKLGSFDIQNWEFKKYTIVFGEFNGFSYMCISMDY
jgi:hypothetical protein